MISKISLGTVQFGQDYGIANIRGKVPKDEVTQILDYAKSAGIECLDTAFNYGESESVIGKYFKEHPGSFKIISKLSSLKGAQRSLEQSLQRLEVSELYGYLLHRFEDIKENADGWNEMIGLKKQGKVKKIGFSLYSPDELVFLLDKEISFDIVQVPYSVFDRRFEEYFDILRKKKIEIQVRSIFLQGLLFMNSNDLPASLEAARLPLEKLQRIAEDQKIFTEALCLNFVMLNPHIDTAVIGVDSLNQLKGNVASLNLKTDVKRLYNQLNKLRIEEENILLPYKWNLKNRVLNESRK